jgi:hypothetical protein
VIYGVMLSAAVASGVWFRPLLPAIFTYAMLVPRKLTR